MKLCACVVLDSKSPSQQTDSSLFNMMKQEPISGVPSTGHLASYHSDEGLISEKNYLVDDRGLLNGTVLSGPGPGLGTVHHSQMTRVNGLRVNYANRGGTIRSYHCRLCRKVRTAVP